MNVFEYKHLSYYEMLRIYEDQKLFEVQGRSLVIEHSLQLTEDFLKHFLNLVFPVVSKMVLMKDNHYTIVCNKYHKEGIEPFEIVDDVSLELGNDTNAIAKYIVQPL